jgi:uncharacterized integral membrane protein
MIPWKLIIVVIVAVLLALFIGFNLNNKCEISFVFGRVADVPVYFTILLSFIAGLAAALPFSIRHRFGKGKVKDKKAEALSAPGKADSANGVKDADEEVGVSSEADKVTRGEKNNDGKKTKHADGKKAD